jgi:uncharacterized protein (TIGR00106 family)
MSVMVNFSVFPIGEGQSLSGYAARAVQVVRDSGLNYETGPMGTVIEGEWDDVLGVVAEACRELEKECGRVYLSLTADSRPGRKNGIESKTASLNEKLKSLENKK